ncbi:aryl-alcohol oxidase [Ephemerocybe angulata]|uniref:pyranose dehydrogenase (acceptor) n=1 Tax=Ephemerocybe angulata TaxID=980116 RepID=A0A8H6HHG6_9AGAR|nr:aryl-alcohol oxidase [Tulosesus angulatus]
MKSFAILLSFLLLSVQLANAAVYQNLAALPSNEQYDVIIVGGGTAGPVIASRLTENPRTTVLLIEAGPDDDGAVDLQIPANYPAGIERKHYWNYTTTPQSGLNGRAITYDRGHVLGGCSSINGMVYTRGAGDDYDRWAKVTGDNGWRWNSLFPLIKRHERWSGAVGGRNVTGQYDPAVHGYEGYSKVALPWSGPNAFDNLCLEQAKTRSEFPYNRDPNSGKPLGLTWAQSTFGGGERNSASKGYLPASVRSRANLNILVNSHVTRVLSTGKASNKDFRTVEIGTTDGARKTVTAKTEVVLSAGSIGTPQILLLSGIGNKAELKALGIDAVHELNDVGKNLSDHIATVAFGTTTVPDAPPVDRAAALLQWNQNRTGPLTEAVGHQILWTRLPKDSEAIRTYGDPSAGSNAPHIEIALMNGLPGQLYGGAAVLLTPQSRGSVTLASSDPFTAPLINLNFLTHPFDFAALKEGVRAMKRFYASPVFSSYIATPIGPDPDAGDAAFEDFTRNVGITTLHAVGTAAMSAKGAKGGVVDPDLKVKGLKGLSIADASVIPYVPTGHSMAPVYILAERASDLIRSRC